MGARFSGEHRLPACRSRQLAETGEMSVTGNYPCKDVAGRAACNYRLAACAPQNAPSVVGGNTDQPPSVAAATYAVAVRSVITSHGSLSPAIVTDADAALGVPWVSDSAGVWEWGVSSQLA